MEKIFAEYTVRLDITALVKFEKHLEITGITTYRIAHDLDINKSYLCQIFRRERQLSETLRQRMNDYLGTDF